MSIIQVLAKWKLFLKKQVNIFEFGSHFHVIPPWLEIYKSHKNTIFIPKELNSDLLSILDSYNTSAELIDMRRVFWNILRYVFKFFKKYSIIVVSTAREFLLTKVEFVNILILILVKPDIVCIRNPNAWFISKDNFGHQSFLRNFNSLVSIFLRQGLAKRATFIVCESQSQTKYIESKLKGRNTKNCFSFPGRLIDVKPKIESDLCSLKKEGKLIVGVLGSISERKKDYEIILKSIDDIQPDLRPMFVFLGSKVLKNSYSIIDRFKDVSEVLYPVGTTISEIDFYSYGQICDVLISPLRTEINYGSKFGTGSLADGIALQKLIIFPESIEIDESLNQMLIRFKNVTQLKNIFLLGKNEFAHKLNLYHWTVKEMQKMLKV